MSAIRLYYPNPNIVKQVWAHRSKDVGPRAPYTNLRGLFFLSNQGIRYALVKCDDRSCKSTHLQTYTGPYVKQRMWGPGPHIQI